MKTLLVRIDSPTAFNNFVDIVKKHFKNAENDFDFLRNYFFRNGRWEPLSFTHLAVEKDGNVFPTTATNVTPETKVCTSAEMEKNVTQFGVGDISIKKAKLYDMVEAYAKTKDDAVANNDIMQPLCRAIEYANTPEVATAIKRMVLTLLGKNGEDAPYFEQRASAICLLASEERDLFEPFPTELNPVPNGEICRLVEEYATTQDFYRANSIHVELNDKLEAANPNKDVLRVKESAVGNMLTDRETCVKTPRITPLSLA